ncbi:MAG: right-handed parallel beta-helix repeat-containing protein [Myxococcaceae bacterium]
MKRLVCAVAVLAGAIACSVSLSEHEGRACDPAHSCEPGLECQGGTCVDPESLASQDGGTSSDGGTDGSVDPADDGGTDDAGTEPEPDAGTNDAGVIPGTDAGTEEYPLNTFFVDPAGDDANDGRSPETPWKTVGKASTAPLPPGSWVLFKGGGVWYEMLAPTRSGTEGNPILFGAYGTGRPVLDGTLPTDQPAPGTAAVNVNNKSWLIVRGLELRNRRGGTQLVYLQNTNNVRFEDLYMHDAEKGFHASPSAPSHGITISQVVVRNISGGSFTHGGFVPKGGTGWVISDSEFSNVEQSCIIDEGNGTQFLRNRFFDCGKITTTSDRHGVFLKGPNAVLRDNEVYDTAGACLYVTFEGAVLEGNRLHGCGTSGIEWAEQSTQPGSLVARRNRIWDARTGITLGAATSQRFLLSNNSILTVLADGTAATAGVVVKTNAEVALENNLVTGSAPTVLSVSRAAPTGAWVDRTNVWHTTGSTPPFSWNAAAMTLAQYQTASAQSTSTDVDPKLKSTSPTAPEFTLVSSTPVRDFGVSSPSSGTLTPGCDGAVDHYCGAAPEPGALELLTP